MAGNGALGANFHEKHEKGKGHTRTWEGQG